MGEIRIAIVGVGNCASALVQGIHYYGSQCSADSTGIMHWDIGGYSPCDIKIVAAFDVDYRKVGKDVSEAILAAPNCTSVFVRDIPPTGTVVRMGPVLDGVARHFEMHDRGESFVVSDEPEPSKEQVVNVLKETDAAIMVIYLPVGSEQAARWYTECCLAAGVGLVNCIPVFIASDGNWSGRFQSCGLPLIGDDIKSQMGATIVHRALAELFKTRGVHLDHTYQLNVGGNTDFLNMLDQQRLLSKRVSKTEAVKSASSSSLADRDVHVGPSDYVPWLRDNKVCFIRMEGRIFGDIPIDLELRLSVEDSPNSAGVVVDAVRCCKLALDRGIAGVLEGPSAYFMKRPPKQFTDADARSLTESFILGEP
jgi:myo-inositol-1-phosphate synthase